MDGAELITCDICGKATAASGEDTLLFGEWMRRMQLTVHYFCLLLSTNLPQRGSDVSGIMGFLVRDIRKEVAAARKRICCYCAEPGATIKCATCGKYFDIVCSVGNHCTMQFCGQFLSYCSECPPMDEYRKQLVANPPNGVTCDICMVRICVFGLYHVAFPECCRLGFVHKMCLRKYALSSGYYLSCIWCRSSEFRSTIRLQGIFVPDRDATWERQSNAYRELHMRTLRCDEKDCLCSHGTSYNKKLWYIYACQVCGSTGAHAQCLARSVHLRKGAGPIKFTCTGCQKVEKKLASKPERRLTLPCLQTNKEDQVDTSFFVTKEGSEVPASTGITETEAPMFSDDETDDSSLNSSVVTVIPNQRETIEGVSAFSPASTSSIESPREEEPLDFMHLRALPKPMNPMMLRESFNCPGQPYFYLMVYEFDNNDKCKGSCMLRFDDEDPRVKDRSEEALRRVQVRPEDVYFRNKDCGDYATTP
ncbi:hypothetical protein KR054_006398 [Drosophila jambulina]|nr:hypothetical protein KR054_006398 [Drosophila jambulina]